MSTTPAEERIVCAAMSGRLCHALRAPDLPRRGRVAVTREAGVLVVANDAPNGRNAKCEPSSCEAPPLPSMRRIVGGGAGIPRGVAIGVPTCDPRWKTQKPRHGYDRDTITQ